MPLDIHFLFLLQFKERSSIDFGFLRDAAFTLFQATNVTIGKDETYTTILKRMRQVNFTGKQFLEFQGSLQTET